MSRGNLIVGLAGVALGFVPAAAQETRPKAAPAGPDAPKAEAGASAGAKLPDKPIAPDFKVVFWFGRTGLRHQVYDLRKGQYTKAVDDWVHQPDLQFDASGYLRPARLATVRDVYLAVEPGKTEQEKLDAAIRREEGRILGLDGPRQASRSYFVPLTPYAYRPHRLSADTSNLSYGRRAPFDGSMSSVGHPGIAPFSGSSPVPVPYPRPHP